MATGCYTLQPVATTGPLFGSEVALDINDAGRVALGASIAPEISQLEGRLVRKDSNEYVLAVSVVRQLRDVEQKWTGEKIIVKSEYVTAVQQRRLSRGRSVLLGSAAVVLPELVALRRGMARLLGRPVGLSGSGPTCWVLYSSLAEAEKAATLIHEAFRDGRLPDPGGGRPFVGATTIAGETTSGGLTDGGTS